MCLSRGRAGGSRKRHSGRHMCRRSIELRSRHQAARCHCQLLVVMWQRELGSSQGSEHDKGARWA